ncbi:MAG TPA: hypothetical protein VKY41_04280 [Xanthomarina sp.]|nr:hypothetical protein [Xanthomarina sp.]
MIQIVGLRKQARYNELINQISINRNDLPITMTKKLLSWIFFSLIMTQFLQAQDIGNLKDQKPFTIHGSIGGGANGYSSNEEFPTRDPFSWNLYGNFTASVYGLSLPFSFAVSQFSESYTTPFSQFGISPSYKWAKLHLGYRNISFSPLVFDGQSFMGAGIELTPKNIYFGAFYGRLNKAISEDHRMEHAVEPQYKRTGYGVKVGVGGDHTNFSLQYFHAKDDENSIERANDSLTTILPQENSVVGTSWKFTFFKKLALTGDAAVSVLSRDLSYATVDSIGEKKVPTIIQKLIPVNSSSVFSWSGQVQLAIMLTNFNAILGYRRVEPDFKSLGVPYALDDIEMISANVNTSFNKGKINLNAAFNSQHNNLHNMLSTKLVTRTGNVSLNTFVNQHLNINMNMTGVRILQKDGLLELNDLQRLDQMMITAVLAPSLNFSNYRHQHTISGSLTYTNLDDQNPSTKDQTNGNNISASLNYGLYFTQKYFDVNTSVLYSVYEQQNSQYTSLGFNVGGNVQLLQSRSLNLQGSVGYFLNKSSDSPTGNNYTFSFNGSYMLFKSHSLGLYASYMITPPVNLNPLNEIDHVPYAVNSKMFTGGITYAYNF